jgi:Tfp pilus assembly protein PilE
MKNSFEKGISLLELICVLLIAMIITTISVRFYEDYKKTKDISLFQTSVSELMDALNSYYFINCPKNGTVTDVSVAKLQETGLIGNNLYNPWNKNLFMVEIANTSTGENPFYVFKVIAPINTNNPTYNLALANYIRGALDGDPSGGSAITWTRLPSHSTDDLSSNQWILNQGQGQVFMPGRYTTAINTGMHSKFWILNSGLQSFTKMTDANACPN